MKQQLYCARRGRLGGCGVAVSGRRRIAAAAASPPAWSAALAAGAIIGSAIATASRRLRRPPRPTTRCRRRSAAAAVYGAGLRPADYIDGASCHMERSVGCRATAGSRYRMDATCEICE